MIDSSGQRFLRADGTVFDLLPVGQVIGLAGTLLVVLFVLIRPEASYGLGVSGRLLFWSLHVGAGLAALWVASRTLASRSPLFGGSLAAVLVTGVVGIAIAAPAYLALDVVFAPYIIDLDPDPPMKSWTETLMNEMVQLAPWFMATWLLMNLPILLPHRETSVRLDDGVTPPTPDSVAGKPPVLPAAAQDSLLLSVPPVAETEGRRQRFLNTLPGIVGTDVVAVASDLHYLNVWTVTGRTTVLGNLRDVVADLGDIGMQVHRSHWVSHAHVRRIVGTGGDAACILSNELRVPISRRRWKTVREQYGRGVIHHL